MHNVLSSQVWTQFAWWNRIPISAWGLLIAIGLLANLLVGYATRPSRSGKLLLPLVLARSVFLVPTSIVHAAGSPMCRWLI